MEIYILKNIKSVEMEYFRNYVSMSMYMSMSMYIFSNICL